MRRKSYWPGGLKHGPSVRYDWHRWTMTSSLKGPSRTAQKRDLDPTQKTLLKNALLGLSKSDLSILNTSFSTIESSIAQTKGYLAVLKGNFQALEQSPLIPLWTVRTQIRQNLVTISESLDLMWKAEESLTLWTECLNSYSAARETKGQGPGPETLL